MYEFTERAGDLTDLILTSFDPGLLLPCSDPNKTALFQNGDRMEIDLTARTMDFDSPTPAKFTSSRLNFKRHKWLVEGLIRDIRPIQSAANTYEAMCMDN